jgi:hypothetical protein
MSIAKCYAGTSVCDYRWTLVFTESVGCVCDVTHTCLVLLKCMKRLSGYLFKKCNKSYFNRYQQPK